jgi:hypothetical protein
MSKTTTVLNYDQSFLVNGYSLSGISSINLDTDFGVSFVQTLGKKNFGHNKINPSVGKVSLSRSLIYADPVLSFTGDSCFSGVFSYGSNQYGFESGYLSDYSVSCSVGQVASVSCGFSVYGEMKSGAAVQTGVSHPGIFVPSPRSIQISNDYGNSNRIKSFDYSLSIPRKARYSVGPNLFPDSVESNGSITISASANFDVGGFSFLDLNNFVRYVSAPNFTIYIKNRDLSQTLMTLPVSNAQIVGQQIESSVDAPLSITLQYQGYIE